MNNVFITSLWTGQFISATIALLVAIFLISFPKDALVWLVVDFYKSVKAGVWTGYVVGAVSVAGWVLHVRSIKEAHEKELKRINEEKYFYQQIALGRNLESNKPE